ncbi:VOC family protein [Actinokineospora auranticolor]|uniref:Putative enzyme related to lactoylglutathione lyase n=1 Tax=Actinokineospora auranticolor TaxID=155976 RepID=A0A2S6GFZ1_9PSEU|nr:VOC family protein [Actinokineospora auranticolor]PPK64149.1 putative enzyme related to lactoylglutathione lyase [Actinokineospora auranticolor]
MASRLVSVGWDAGDMAGLARFWADLLGWEITLANEEEVDLVAPDQDGAGLGLTFVPVPDRKTTRNRVHLDLSSSSLPDQDAVVARAELLGATRADIGQGDVPWVVLRDPEGNEFCVLEPRPEYADTGRVAAIVVDAADPGAQANFWAAATNWSIVRDEPAFATLRALPGHGPWLEFLRGETPHTAKNRLHLEVAGEPGDEQTEIVQALCALGATPADIGQGPDVTWHVLRDPEANEFCVLSSR